MTNKINKRHQKTNKRRKKERNPCQRTLYLFSHVFLDVALSGDESTIRWPWISTIVHTYTRWKYERLAIYLVISYQVASINFKIKAWIIGRTRHSPVCHFGFPRCPNSYPIELIQSNISLKKRLSHQIGKHGWK